MVPDWVKLETNELYQVLKWYIHEKIATVNKRNGVRVNYKTLAKLANIGLQALLFLYTLDHHVIDDYAKDGGPGAV